MQIDKLNKKIITVSYILFSVIVGWCTRIVLEMLASVVGSFNRYYNIDLVQHGVPILVGLLCFLFLQFNKKTLRWADEVVVEVSKVTWPSKKDTFSMMVLVSIMLLISGVILGLLDFFSRALVNTIMSF